MVSAGRKRKHIIPAMVCAAAMLLAGCGGISDNTALRDDSKTQTFGTTGEPIRIASGSENREVSEAVRKAAADAGVTVTLDYMGSLDIMETLRDGGSRNGADYDAVWPASSMWISMGDDRHLVKDTKSTSVTPIVFGVSKTKAEQLGWADGTGRTRNVPTSEILDKVRDGELKFSMTSATQSNSGASAYLGFLNALSGSTDPITSDTLRDGNVTEQAKTILKGVDRSSGSSDWLKDMVVADPDRFDAMVNYESLVIQADKQLTQAGKDPLLAVYPADGLAISDSPLGYIDRGQDQTRHDAFTRFQTALTSKDSKLLFEQAGRRTGLGGTISNPNDPQVQQAFNPQWGINTDTTALKSITMPAADVTRQALDLYQTALRKPSWTIWVVDYSGSMYGEGKKGVVDGMNAALNPDKAKTAGIQPGSKDVNILIPFDSNARTTLRADGTNTTQLLKTANDEDASGGTNIYDGLRKALDNMPPDSQRNDYTVAIALLTDGQSSTIDQNTAIAEYRDRGQDTPIFPIMFGDADPSQLNDLAALSNGKVFDGRTGNLSDVFRQVKGYN